MKILGIEYSPACNTILITAEFEYLLSPELKQSTDDPEMMAGYGRTIPTVIQLFRRILCISKPIF